MKKFFSQLLANTRAKKTKGFTLIELLIVIGILGILVVAVLLTLNPGEAQKKSRDAKRVKDLQTLQAALQQYVDGGGIVPAGAGVTTWTSDAAGGGVNASTTTATDGTGWIQSQGTATMNVSAYINALPKDTYDGVGQKPTVNGSGAPVTCASPLLVQQNFRYRVGMRQASVLTPAVPGTYEIDARLEALSSCDKVVNDGGSDPVWYEIGNDLTAL